MSIYAGAIDEYRKIDLNLRSVAKKHVSLISR